LFTTKLHLKYKYLNNEHTTHENIERIGLSKIMEHNTIQFVGSDHATNVQSQ